MVRRAAERLTIRVRWGRRLGAPVSMRRGVATVALLGAVSTSAVALASASPTDAALRLTMPGGRDSAWWSPAAAPSRWTAPGLLHSAARWRHAHPGVEWSEIPLRGAGEASALRLVALRLDPTQLRLSLHLGVDASSARPAWSLDDAPHDAVVAVNAGMFVDALPWGWVVQRGDELLPPGRGPLSSAVVIGRSGTVTMVDGDDLSRWRARGDVAAAFQTYPTLLVGDGVVPVELREGATIDRAHRDARLAIGLDRDGRLLLVLTRLDIPLPGADRLPVGLTVPEMAAVMGSLGARQAALLDGGISAQLRLREANGALHNFRGLRDVPLALIAQLR